MEIKFWQDQQKQQIDPNLFSETAETLAKTINNERINSRDKLNKPTQIRKFFDEVIRFQGMLQGNSEQFTELLPYIKMLNAKAAYATGRDLIGTEFKGFLSDSLKQVNNRKDFDLFCSFFEAFLGFYKFYAEKEKSGGGQNFQQQGGGHHPSPHDNRRPEPQVFRKQ